MVVLSDLLEGSSSSSSTHGQKYDVFLSFNGYDTRRSFTDHLRMALRDANITTEFVDEEVGDGNLKPEVESAIKASRASLIVLSKNYAHSTCCLDELVLILEQRTTSNHIVMPIFYHVERNHVKEQKNTFEDALAEHKHKMEAETNAIKRREMAQKIEHWKKALREVADLKGMDIVNGRPESEFIEEIVDNIFRRLHLSSRSPKPLLIGMGYSIELVTSWLKDRSSHTADILTIMGMAGIGKTSLVKYVYWFHSHEFDISSFIEDISRRYKDKSENKSGGLHELQKQLYADISDSPIQDHDASKYTPMIEEALASKKVFLVLDDIDCHEQLDALLGSKGIHPGSKIIITTRDARLIECCALLKTDAKPEHAEYELKGLDHKASKELFCFHAFMSDNPRDGYKEMSEKLVTYCDGHPLALKVLGNSLYNRDLPYWEEFIECLSKETCGISSVLRMSYDSLEENDKDLFKHMACFFVGMDKYVTETILKACNIDTRSGIKNLIDRSLLSISNNELQMHQLLQEMGRFVVSQESPDKPWERSRLWGHDALKVLKHKKGTEKVLGLSLDMSMLKKEKSGESFELKPDVFSKMDKLMLLQLNSVQINEPYINLPEELRWLCMHGFPLNSIPSDLPMENLVALDLSHSSITSFDISNTNPTQFEKRQKPLLGLHSKDKWLLGSLRILILSSCVQLQRVGGFDRLPALERLIATNCNHLVEVSESIEQCAKLDHIDLSYCNKLQKLPRAIGMLKNVKTILLDGCNIGEPQIEIRNMDSHEMLKANNIGINTKSSSSVILEAMPSDLKLYETSLPMSLVSLSLVNNNLSTESFPTDFSFLSKLKELYLDGNPLVSLPICVRTLPSLEYLSLIDCTMLPSVVHPPQKLIDWSVSLNSTETDNMMLEDVYDLSPLVLSLYSHDIETFSYEIEGKIKIQPMAGVEEKILCRLGWSNILSRGSEKSEIQMYYEFGIFSTFYVGREMPNWITDRSKGPSISFTIPSSRNNLIGLNFCYVLTFLSKNVRTFGLPMIVINNTRRNKTWMYKHYIKDVTLVGDCLILLSHWMFGMNEMECDDYVTITVTEPSGSQVANQFTEECGLSFVYDDGKRKEEEEGDELGYYKSWNHIIGGDLSRFLTTTGKYLLDMWGNITDATEASPNRLELVGEDNFHKEEKMRFEALSQRKSGIVANSPEEEEEEESDDVQMGLDAGKGRKRLTMMMRRKRKTMMMIRRSRVTKSHRTLSLLAEDSSNLRAETISKGPSNVAKKLEEGADSLSLTLGTSSKGPFDAAMKMISDQTGNASSGLSSDDFSMPKSKKKRIRKAGEDGREELDLPLLTEDNWKKIGRRRRSRLMNVDSSGGRENRPNTFSFTTSEFSFLEDASTGNVDNGIPLGTETKLADFSHAQFSRLVPAFMAEAVRRYDCLVATELECVRLRNELAEHKTVVVEQAQHMDVVLDPDVRMKAMEAEHSGLVDRLSQAEVARARAETQLQHSEALREDANKNMLSLEASNSELANRLELLESENKRLMERVAVLEAADAKRVGS